MKGFTKFCKQKPTLGKKVFSGKPSCRLAEQARHRNSSRQRWAGIGFENRKLDCHLFVYISLKVATNPFTQSEQTWNGWIVHHTAPGDGGREGYRRGAGGPRGYMPLVDTYWFDNGADTFAPHVPEI